tara:strand:- start:2423 stop:2689 length:267 start_codon:yes stop_codon:yes gene_type:complete
VVLTTKNLEGEMPSSLEKNMKVLILSNTVANKQKVSAGDVIDLSYDEAQSLISYKKAEVYKGTAKKESNRSVGLEKSDKPKPKTRSKK